jgi:hypothetical protein
MDTFVNNKFTGYKISPPIDFSLRVETEQNIFGANVLVVASMFNGNIQKEWMSAFEATDFVLRNPALGVSIRSAHIEHKGMFDEWGQSF